MFKIQKSFSNFEFTRDKKQKDLKKEFYVGPKTWRIHYTREKIYLLLFGFDHDFNAIEAKEWMNKVTDTIIYISIQPSKIAKIAKIPVKIGSWCCSVQFKIEQRWNEVCQKMETASAPGMDIASLFTNPENIKVMEFEMIHSVLIPFEPEQESQNVFSTVFPNSKKWRYCFSNLKEIYLRNMLTSEATLFSVELDTALFSYSVDPPEVSIFIDAPRGDALRSPRYGSDIIKNQMLLRRKGYLPFDVENEERMERLSLISSDAEYESRQLKKKISRSLQIPDGNFSPLESARRIIEKWAPRCYVRKKLLLEHYKCTDAHISFAQRYFDAWKEWNRRKNEIDCNIDGYRHMMLGFIVVKDKKSIPVWDRDKMLKYLCPVSSLGEKLGEQDHFYLYEFLCGMSFQIDPVGMVPFETEPRFVLQGSKLISGTMYFGIPFQKCAICSEDQFFISIPEFFEAYQNLVFYASPEKIKK